MCGVAGCKKRRGEVVHIQFFVTWFMGCAYLMGFLYYVTLSNNNLLSFSAGYRIEGNLFYNRGFHKWMETRARGKYTNI
jgi:hypothetical protein